MPDALAPILPQVATETADGFLVITRFRLDKPAVPPYAYHYSYTHYDHSSDAHEHFTDAENGEMGRYEPVAIVPCKAGIPLGAKAIL